MVKAAHEDRPSLRAELLRLAAQGYETSKMLQDAAECWREAGEHGRAADAFVSIERFSEASECLRAAGRYGEALAMYELWQERLHRSDVVERLRCLLGQSTCHLLRATAEPPGAEARTASRRVMQSARELLKAARRDKGSQSVPCFVVLAEHGQRVGRQDLVHEGYELALHRLRGPGHRGEWREICRAYLRAVSPSGDRLLVQSIEQRLAEAQDDLPRSRNDDPSTRLASLLSRCEREQGQWVQDLPDARAEEAPPLFSHYFVCIESLPPFVSRGAIVTGESWQSARTWKVLHGYTLSADAIVHIKDSRLSYLGSRWDPVFLDLAEELHKTEADVLLHYRSREEC